MNDSTTKELYPSYYIGHENVYKRAKQSGKKSPWGIEEDNLDYLEFCKNIIQKYFSANQTINILEFGTGPGVNLIALKRDLEKGNKLQLDIHGIDIAPTAIESANEMCEKLNMPAKFEVFDLLIQHSKFSNQYDVLLDGHCLHCIIGDEDRTQFIQNAFNYLKPNGLLIMETMTWPPAIAMQNKFEIDHRGCLIQNGIATRQLEKPETIKKRLINAGFNIVHYEEIKEEGINPSGEKDSDYSQTSAMILCEKV